ncbi:glycosyltransferase [Salinimicrobium sp. CDJ15-81-2]|nr:glycosyltransferase [Salinimicrobium nanhaiense]
MRVLQLIDSLRSGGAEKMSVTYTNALAKRIDASFLCCTRMEGLLKKQLAPEVGYLFLNKKNTLDLQAFSKLRKFVKENKIDLIQAHSSSWFLALMVKLSLPGVKLVWHDHYGRELSNRKPGLLRPASKYFDGIIAVNKDLEAWSKKNLYSKEVRLFKNFLPENSGSGEKVELKGGDSFKIICVANFRPQKDHLNLLKAFRLISGTNSNLGLHLVGKVEKDDYSEEINKYISNNELEEKVFIYGEQGNIGFLLKQADLGVLSSASEGLPVALLEYGRAGLPVVCTEVGQCAEVLRDAGKLVPPCDAKALAEAINFYLCNTPEKEKDAEVLNLKVFVEYSEEKNILEVINFFEYIPVI